MSNNGDGTYDVGYDDGDKEIRVLESRINIIRINDEAQEQSTNPLPTVAVQEGTEPESSQPQSQQQQPSQPSTTPPSSSSSRPTSHSITENQLQGQGISANDEDGMINSTLREKPAATTAAAGATTKKWRGGKILKKYPDGTYDIQLTNGGMLSRVKRKLIRAAA